MPRFFFDIGDDGHVFVDGEGLELPSAQRAKVEAVAALPAIAREADVGEHWAVHSRVRNERGDLIFEATLRFECKHHS